MYHFYFKCPRCGKTLGSSVGVIPREIDLPFDVCMYCHAIMKSKYSNEWECRSPASRAAVILNSSYDKEEISYSLVRTANPDYRAFLESQGCKFYPVDKSKYDMTVKLRKTIKIKLFEETIGAKLFLVEESWKIGSTVMTHYI